MRRDADARRTAEEREAQLQTRRDARARRTTEEREAELQMRRDADNQQQHISHQQNQTFTNNSIISIIIYVNSMQIII